MKHVILRPYPRIQRLVDVASSNSVEVSDELALEIQTHLDAKIKVFLFDDSITTVQQELSKGNRIEWNDETSQYERIAIPVPVPESISAWQAHAALKITPYNDGTLYDAVVQALQSMPDDNQKVVILTAWEKDAKFVRSSPTITAIASALNLSDAQINEVFILADSLKV